MAIGHRRVGVMRRQRLGLTPTPALPISGGGRCPGASLPPTACMRSSLPPIVTSLALAFALAFIGDRLTRRENASPFLWCLTEKAAREWGAPYGPGLIAFGLDPALVLIVQTRNATDAAWAVEEGLKAGAFIAVLGQIEVKAPIMARRLGLAAQTSRTPCLLLSGHQGGGLPGTLTRWRVAAERSSGAAFDASAPGAPAWHLTLERCRGMAPARSWTVEFRDVAYGFRLAPRFADRAAEADEERHALSG